MLHTFFWNTYVDCGHDRELDTGQVSCRKLLAVSATATATSLSTARRIPSSPGAKSFAPLGFKLYLFFTLPDGQQENVELNL